MRKKGKVFVGMSGGVDSSVTAGLLKERGYEVVGVHLKCWNVDGCAEADAEDARRAAEKLGVPFYVFDMEREYKERVVKYMVDSYRRGLTPNPDVACNQEIKFGLFYQKARALGANYVATGHYARIRAVLRASRDTKPRKRSVAQSTKHRPMAQLSVAKDVSKDQSYFLWTLTQDQLAHCLFPLGELIKKTQVRRLAKKYGLHNADKKDSQGICFIGPVSLEEFLSQYIPQKRGEVLSVSGKKLGEHKGAHLYTIGQRRGVGVGGSAKPLYVAKKDTKKNLVFLAEENSPELFKKEIFLTDVNFINAEKAKASPYVFVRVRYRQPLSRAKIILPSAKSKNEKGLKIYFDKEQKFIADGQSAVFYSKDGEVLGGGVIKSSA